MDRTEVLKEIQNNVALLSRVDAPEYKYIPLHQKPSPSVVRIQSLMNLLRSVIFPGFYDDVKEIRKESLPYYLGVYLEQIYDLLHEQIYYGLCFEKDDCACSMKQKASDMAMAFINRISHVKYLLSTDEKAI